ncbi:MAG: phage tail tube protein [Selenomonadaceae bacterium]|nr:phage tail tube protein [Selenomonadaceae bacterium]
MFFDIQKFARDYQDVTYRGRRRLSGNFGRLYISGVMIFEISAFEAKITANRDTVIIGQSEDSKITSLAGEGSFTIKQVFSRGFDKLLENWKNGYDERFVFVGVMRDPDTVQHQEERVRLENVAINEIMVQKWAKGEVVEKEIPFTWTPEDTYYENIIDLPNESVVHETNGGF